MVLYCFDGFIAVLDKHLNKNPFKAGSDQHRIYECLRKAFWYLLDLREELMKGSNTIPDPWHLWKHFSRLTGTRKVLYVFTLVMINPELFIVFNVFVFQFPGFSFVLIDFLAADSGHWFPFLNAEDYTNDNKGQKRLVDRLIRIILYFM